MIRFEQRAKIFFDQLKPSQQRQIQQTLRALEHSPQDFDAALNVRKLEDPDNTYLVPVGASLRVLFTIASDCMVEVQDIVTQERLNAFHRAMIAAGEQ